MATEEGFVCESCIDAVVASAKVAGEDYENAEYVHMLALKFGARVSDHFCEEEDDEEVDCNCGCRVGILPWEESFGTVTTKGDVCDSCLEAVYEAATSVGEQHDDLLYTYMLARTTGGNIFDHECAAEDDDEVDCHCGCQPTRRWGGERVPYELSIGPPFDLDLTLEYDQGHRWRPDGEDPGWYTSVLGRDFVRVRQKTSHGPIEFEPCTEEIASKLRCSSGPMRPSERYTISCGTIPKWQSW